MRAESAASVGSRVLRNGPMPGDPRIATAIPLAATAVGSVWLPPMAFAAVTGVVVALAAWEWSALSGVGAPARRALYVAVVTGIGAALALVPGAERATGFLMFAAALFWAAALALVVATQAGRFSLARWPTLRASCGVFVLVPAWLGLVRLRIAHGGVADVLFLLVLIWCTDTAAYYAGRKWGRHRLCEAVSPGKSWEGALAGLLAGILVAVLYAAYGNGPERAMVIFLAIAALTIAISIVGDLFESMVKRSANLKDSGTLLPGHGGVLDRIDSLTAAVPVFLLGVALAGGPP
jgi:phosphatidate cytidylyltransferase